MQNVCLGSDTNEIWQIEKLKSPVAKTLYIWQQQFMINLSTIFKNTCIIFFYSHPNCYLLYSTFMHATFCKKSSENAKVDFKVIMF